MGRIETPAIKRKLPKQTLPKPNTTAPVVDSTNFQVGVSEKAGKCDPVLKSIFDGSHQQMGGMERALKFCQEPVQLLGQWLGLSFSHSQPVHRRLVFDLPFNAIQPGVDLDYFIAEFIEFSTRVRVAAHLSFGAVFKQGVEAVGCVCLHEARKVFEEFLIARKGLVGREVKDHSGMRDVTAIHSHFAAAHFAPANSVLDFYWAVIGLDDFRCQDLYLEALVEWLQGQRTSFEPVAQCGSGNDCLLAFSDFRLAVLRQTVVALLHDCRTKQAWSRETSGNGWARFFPQ